LTHLTRIEEIPKVDGKWYYLATPYNHPDKAVMEARMEYHDRVDARLLELGHYTLCPMEKHYKVKYGNLPVNYEYWRYFCRSMLKLCEAGLIVVAQEGWEDSVGVTDEIQQAFKLDRPVYYTTLG